jgi:hypothetical protein
VNPVNEKHWWALAVLGESDPPVTPFEPSFFSANEVNELINTFSGERVVGRGNAKEGSARQ